MPKTSDNNESRTGRRDAAPFSYERKLRSDEDEDESALLDADLKALCRRSTSLTKTETRLLRYLARTPGAPIARNVILREVLGYVDGVESHAVETHVWRIRGKIEAEPANPEHLIRDQHGYRLILACSPLESGLQRGERNPEGGNERPLSRARR